MYKKKFPPLLMLPSSLASTLLELYFTIASCCLINCIVLLTVYTRDLSIYFARDSVRLSEASIIPWLISLTNMCVRDIYTLA